MLSYQHGYHAGNHADVLKHLVLLAIARHMQQKPVPISFIDTHAGAGSYALASVQAEKTAESATGIEKLYALPESSLPPALLDYVNAVAHFNPPQQFTTYPGSPLLMTHCLRTHEGIADTLRVFERHPGELKLLEAQLIKHTPQPPAGVRMGRVRPVLIQGADGFEGLAHLLPPQHRRALVLMDPSYEMKTDYRTVVETIKIAMQRFPGGTYAIWYPMLRRVEAQQMIPRLKKLCAEYSKSAGVDFLNATLAISGAQPDGFGGLWGSGMFVINPPYTLAQTLKNCLPVVKTQLAQDGAARWTVETT